MLQALKNSGHLFLKCLLLSNSLEREKEGIWVFGALKSGLEYYTMENFMGNLNSVRLYHLNAVSRLPRALLSWLALSPGAASQLCCL